MRYVLLAACLGLVACNRSGGGGGNGGGGGGGGGGGDDAPSVTHVEVGCDGEASAWDWLIWVYATTDMQADGVVCDFERGSYSYGSLSLDDYGDNDWYAEIWEDDAGGVDCDVGFEVFCTAE